MPFKPDKFNPDEVPGASGKNKVREIIDQFEEHVKANRTVEGKYNPIFDDGNFNNPDQKLLPPEIDDVPVIVPRGDGPVTDKTINNIPDQPKQ